MEPQSGGSDVELLCRTLQVEHKLFYFDLKENPRGKYLKISEKTSATRSTIIVPDNGIVWFHEIFTYYVSTSEQEAVSKELQLDTKVFYFDVGANKRGRFLKISEASANRNRSTIIVPGGGTQGEDGWVSFRDILAQIIFSHQPGSDGGAGTQRRKRMPGPGPHTGYALTTGLGMMRISRGRFSPQHCLFYAANAFLGPDLGSFAEWLAGNLTGGGGGFGHLAMAYVHHPLYYILLLGLPLSVFYSWLSGVLLKKGLLDSFSGINLSRKQCFLLVAAGSLTHFFLDHLFEVGFTPIVLNSHYFLMFLGSYGLHDRCFTSNAIDLLMIHEENVVEWQENGHSETYTWILSTGWWKGRAPNTTEAVLVVGLLCSSLIAGFIYINRVNPGKSIMTRAKHSMGLILLVMSLYCLWCYSQIYWRNPPQPAVGEEADLGVIVFLAIYFFLPHSLCILSMNQKEHLDSSTHLPL